MVYAQPVLVGALATLIDASLCPGVQMDFV